MVLNQSIQFYVSCPIHLFQNILIMFIILLFRNHNFEAKIDTKNLVSFGTMSQISLGGTAATVPLDDDFDHQIDPTNIKSKLIRCLLLMHDTVVFHWKVSVELIKEQPNEVQKLHEYHKRWQAFVCSLIKMDELLIPLSNWVNAVYKKLYPGYPWFPWFSIMRFFVKIWNKEVYK